MDIKKEKWSKPELVILTRSKPEEAVLSGCKNHWSSTISPGTGPTHCYTRDPSCDGCYTGSMS